ncbi:MAG TPA: GTPase [Methylococcus sp.]|nr:GTPase [Methylococcus sp.]
MKPRDFATLRTDVAAWVNELWRAGWISVEDLEPLAEIDERAPSTLFDGEIHRPLVVAFFGGTGVGKSSLLNRLAGEPVARVGVERPTSREVTLYAHERVRIDRFPAGLFSGGEGRSAESPDFHPVVVSRHQNERLRQVLWIDTPDVDSTETANRALVLRWIPYIDLLVYVVSPERYRDDTGWRMLLRERGTHAWAFVMNHWDHGDPAQLRDFSGLLAEAGFANPHLFRTRCGEFEQGATIIDDFDALRDFVTELADQHLLRQLDARTGAVRLQRLLKYLTGLRNRLDHGDEWRELQRFWEGHWETTARRIREGLAWTTELAAHEFLQGRLRSLRPQKGADGPPTARCHLVWDPWANQLWEDALGELAVEAENRGLPRALLRDTLQGWVGRAGAVVGEEVEERLRGALARPGNRIQRLLYRFSWFLSLVLPLVASGWVGWNVVVFYYRSSAEHLGYLGLDFALHSGLLIFLSWLVPFLLYRALKPSAERNALRGVRAGLQAALDKLSSAIACEIDALQQRERDRILTAQRWIETGREMERQTEAADPRLDRLLVREA